LSYYPLGGNEENHDTHGSLTNIKSTFSEICSPLCLTLLPLYGTFTSGNGLSTEVPEVQMCHNL